MSGSTGVPAGRLDSCGLALVRVPDQFAPRRVDAVVATPSCCCCCCCCLATVVGGGVLIRRHVLVSAITSETERTGVAADPDTVIARPRVEAGALFGAAVPALSTAVLVALLATIPELWPICLVVWFGISLGAYWSADAARRVLPAAIGTVVGGVAFAAEALAGGFLLFTTAGVGYVALLVVLFSLVLRPLLLRPMFRVLRGRGFGET